MPRFLGERNLKGSFFWLIFSLVYLTNYMDEIRQSDFFLENNTIQWMANCIRPVFFCIVLGTAHIKMHDHYNCLKRDFHTSFSFLNDYLNIKLHENLIMKQKV